MRVTSIQVQPSQQIVPQRKSRFSQFAILTLTEESGNSKFRRIITWLRRTMHTPQDLQAYCAVLAHEYPFAKHLNSQARQASADRAWFAIERFYEQCKEHKPG